MKKYRNQILTDIHREKEFEDNGKIRKFMQQLENNQDQNQKMYDVVKLINKMKPKQPLLITSEEGQTTNEEEQSNIIAKYFKNVFYKNAELMPNLQPTPMSKPFTSSEIKTAVSKLKTNKSPGCDEIPVELIKYAPDVIHKYIAEIFNKMASNNECPSEINHGILIPLQKPGKSRGPTSNLRPIILLSTLRKILAVCIMKRIGVKMDEEIAISQAAYRKGRSTTEHVFATKIVIERTITAKNETVHLTLLDMSKAFDSIKRKDVIQYLQNTIEPDELFIIKKMLEVSLAVKCGNTISETFNTDTGAPQGDCASPNIFTYYLAKSLGEKPSDQGIHDHQYFSKNITNNEIPDEIIEHNYTCHSQVQHINIEMEYADDISKITSDFNNIRKHEHDITENLCSKGLKINNSKTEKFVINRNNHQWKKCRFLGTLLDTSEEIKRRKSLTINAANNFLYLFNNNKLTLATKIRLIDTYVEPIFLYNAETWTLCHTKEEEINAFQRKIIRKYVLNIKWPKIISNNELYLKTKIEKWGNKIQFRKLKWFGYIARAQEGTPCKLAMTYALSNYQKRPGRPITTWISSVKNDLKNMNKTWREAEMQAIDNPKEWIRDIKSYIKEK